MSTLNQIRDAFKSTLSANISDLMVYDTADDVVQVPSVVVLPEGCEYVVGMGSCQNWDMRLYVLVPRTEVNLAQDKLDAYISLSGAKSIPAVLKANPTIGLPDAQVVLRKMSNYGGKWESASIEHVGAMLHVDVLVTM